MQPVIGCLYCIFHTSLGSESIGLKSGPHLCTPAIRARREFLCIHFSHLLQHQHYHTVREKGSIRTNKIFPVRPSASAPRAIAPQLVRRRLHKKVVPLSYHHTQRSLGCGPVQRQQKRAVTPKRLWPRPRSCTRRNQLPVPTARSVRPPARPTAPHSSHPGYLSH